MRHGAESRLPAMRHSAELTFVVEYLCEFESICITVLAHESGDPGVQFKEKTKGRKSRETVPLKSVWFTASCILGYFAGTVKTVVTTQILKKSFLQFRSPDIGLKNALRFQKNHKMCFFRRKNPQSWQP
jgi:hypothetical protein